MDNKAALRAKAEARLQVMIPDWGCTGPLDREEYISAWIDGYKAAVAAAEEYCRNRSAGLFQRPLRVQHHHGAALGCDLCADYFKKLLEVL